MELIPGDSVMSSWGEVFHQVCHHSRPEVSLQSLSCGHRHLNPGPDNVTQNCLECKYYLSLSLLLIYWGSVCQAVRERRLYTFMRKQRNLEIKHVQAEIRDWYKLEDLMSPSCQLSGDPLYCSSVSWWEDVGQQRSTFLFWLPALRHFQTLTHCLTNLKLQTWGQHVENKSKSVN